MGYRSPMWIKKQPQRSTIKSRRRKILPTHTMSNINATIEKIFTRKYLNYARNPNIDLQLIEIYSKSDIQHHILAQQFQEQP